MTQKLFTIMLSSVILTTNPLFAMEEQVEASKSIYHYGDITRYDVEDEASYQATLQDAGRDTPFIHISITNEFLKNRPNSDVADQIAAASKPLINAVSGEEISDSSAQNRREVRFQDRIGDVCEKLMTAHPNVTSLELLQEGYYGPSNPAIFKETIPIFPTMEKYAKDDYPLVTLLTPTLPNLTHLTVYNKNLNCISTIRLLLSNAPRLNHLRVLPLTKSYSKEIESGTSKQFTICWGLMKERLECFEWPGACITDTTAESIASFLSTTTSLKYLNLENAFITKDSARALQEAVNSNGQFTLLNIEQTIPLLERIPLRLKSHGESMIELVSVGKL
jgi:hypothetical protein